MTHAYKPCPPTRNIHMYMFSNQRAWPHHPLCFQDSKAYYGKSSSYYRKVTTLIPPGIKTWTVCLEHHHLTRLIVLDRAGCCMVSFYVSLLFQLPCFEGRKVIPLTRMSTGGVMETRHTAAVQVLVYTTTVARSVLVHVPYFCVWDLLIVIVLRCCLIMVQEHWLYCDMPL